MWTPIGLLPWCQPPISHLIHTLSLALPRRTKILKMHFNNVFFFSTLKMDAILTDWTSKVLELPRHYEIDISDRALQPTQVRSACLKAFWNNFYISILFKNSNAVTLKKKKTKKPPGVELLSHMIVLVLIFWETTIIFLLSWWLRW